MALHLKMSMTGMEDWPADAIFSSSFFLGVPLFAASSSCVPFVFWVLKTRANLGALAFSPVASPQFLPCLRLRPPVFPLCSSFSSPFVCVCLPYRGQWPPFSSVAFSGFYKAGGRPLFLWAETGEPKSALFISSLIPSVFAPAQDKGDGNKSMTFCRLNVSSLWFLSFLFF